MADLLQFIVAGLAQGGAYALIAVGFVSIFAVSGVINLAQGEFAALAGLSAISAVSAGLPLPLAVLVAVAVVTVVAIAVERLAIRPVRRMTTLTSIILTLGVSTVIKAVMLLVWGPQGHTLSAFPGGDVTVAGVSIRAQELWILLTCALVGAAVWWFYERTLHGKALRACSEQPVAARLVGISLKQASLVSFGIAGFTGAMAGVVTSPIYSSSWEIGLSLGLKGFVAATLGGLLSVRGAILGGFLLGVLENLVAGYVATGLRDAVAFVVLIVILLARPGGLATHTEARV